MKTIGVFVDTSTVNRILRINEKREKDNKWEEDREYLMKIFQQYLESSVVRFIVNPTVKTEIEDTKDPQERMRLLKKFEEYHFTSYNLTIFPFTFPATFITEEQSKTLEQLIHGIPKFEKDKKIFLDALNNAQVEYLLTTDRKHLVNDTFRRRVKKKGLDKYIRICKPKELYEHLQKVVQL
jgi:predicted nucleic acid-binding protein